VTADAGLADLAADAARQVPDPPGLDQVVEEAGRQRLAAYYLYTALIAGLIGDDDLPPERWPTRVAEPVQRMGLARFAPRTLRGLDAQLTVAEQATRRRPDRQAAFEGLLVDLINQRAFGPLCGEADQVRLARPGGADGPDLELIKDGSVVARCKPEDHWQLVARQLASAARSQDALPAVSRSAEASRWLRETGISHAVSTTVTLAVSIHPLGAAAGLGTRVIRSQIEADREHADAFRRLGQSLDALRSQACDQLREERRYLPKIGTGHASASYSPG
jgi:hypothetical protein